MTAGEPNIGQLQPFAGESRLIKLGGTCFGPFVNR